MKNKRKYTASDLDVLRQHHIYYRVGIIIFTIFVLIVILGVKKSQSEKRQYQEFQAEQAQDSIRRERKAAQDRIRQQQEIEREQRYDSIVKFRRSETPKSEPPKYSWSRLETMVRDLTNEGYYASVWKVNDGTSAWIVIYSKKGRYYIRKFNPETDKYGPKKRLRKYENGKYHVYCDKSSWYKYGPENDLIYEVNGVERDRFINFHTIDLFTPEPAPDGYENWEDYYNDNEEDLYFYYNGR